MVIALLLHGGSEAQTARNAVPNDVVTGDIRDNSVFLQQQMQPAGPKEELFEARVNELLAKMTLREKIGQMTQLEIGMVCDGKDQDLTINQQKLQKEIEQ